MADGLDGRAILVTGAASGLGEAVARRLAADGARLVLGDRDEGRLGAVADELGAASLAGDVTDAAHVDALVALAVERFGRLDGAVNNAGISQPPVGIAKLDEADWRRTIDVNLTSVFLCLRAEIRSMLATGRGGGGGGAIVNTASALGTIATTAGAAYVAAKHGVIGLTKAAALEYSGRGIRVTAVAPGVIETPLVAAQLDDANREHMRALHPVGRLGRAAEVAEFVVFLLSDRASFVTGSTHLVDGGWTAH